MLSVDGRIVQLTRQNREEMRVREFTIIIVVVVVIFITANRICVIVARFGDE